MSTNGSIAFESYGDCSDWQLLTYIHIKNAGWLSKDAQVDKYEFELPYRKLAA